MNNNPQQPEIKESVWSFFIRRRAVSWFLIFGILLLGTFSALTIPRELQPEIKLPYGMVTTVLPGANPLDTETLVTKPLEQEIGTVNNIKKLTSTSSLGVSSIFIEFEADVDLDQSIQELKDAVDRAKPELPESALDPMVVKAEANTFPIITFSLIGKRSLYELTQIAETIQEELENITGVASVDIVGNQTKYIEINLDPQQLKAYGLDIQQVSALVESANFNLPIGIITTDKKNYSVRIDNKFQSIADIENIPLFTLSDENKTTILLKDIATVEEKLTEVSTISKLSIKGEESMETVSVRINKKDGGNILKIVDEAKVKISEMEKEGTIPEGIEIAVSNDNSQFIKNDLGVLTESGYQTIILVVIILFLGLGLREGLLAGLSVPLTFLITFPLMELFGLTLNGLTLFSLVIALGIMVDIAIVIMQSTHAHIKEGMTPLNAAIAAVETYKWALIAGTLTTVFAFFPMLLVQGIIGEFLKSLPITITITLIASLIVSMTLIPSVGTGILKTKKEKRASLLEPIFNWIGTKLFNLLHGILQRKSLRMFTLLIISIAFIASMALPISGTLKAELFPRTDVSYFIIDIETPKGLVLEETEKAATKVEEKLYKISEIDNFLTIIGSSQSQAFTDLVSAGPTADTNLANITVNLVDKELREKASYEIADEIRASFKDFSGAKVSIREVTEGPPSGAAVTVKVSGESLNTLTKIASDLEQILESINGTQNITISLEPGLNEFKFVLDPDKLSYFGLNTAQVSLIVRNTLQGIESTTVTLNDEEQDIFVKYDFPEENGRENFSISVLEDIEIKTPSGENVSLSELGKYELIPSQQSIAHEDQERIVQVQSDLAANVTAVEVTEKLQEQIDKYETPEGYTIKIGGDLDDIAESFNDLYRSMIIGVILIGLSLIWMFNSFKQAFVNLLTLPLGLIGVFPGLYLLGLNLSFPAFLGIVALAGVVVNNSIVLIEKININREAGMEFKEAIAEASRSRLEPIFMTSITTIVGIVPLALTNEFWAGLGFSLAFGLTVSTFFTLTIIPIFYYVFEARKERKRQAQ